MTFGEKLKKLRISNNLTQEELAEKIFVTRTAVSKWETDKGYPSIDSLKELSHLFDISMDELLSDEDVENKKLLDEKNAKRYYIVAITFLSLAAMFFLLAYFLRRPMINMVGICCASGYVFFGLLSKSKHKRTASRSLVVPCLVSRAIIFFFVIAMIILTSMTH